MHGYQEEGEEYSWALHEQQKFKGKYQDCDYEVGVVKKKQKKNATKRKNVWLMHEQRRSQNIVLGLEAN